MLDAGRPPQRIAGLTVFYDHADNTRRYVLAEAPSVVADPIPRLSLILFRGSQSGALLQLETKLAPTDEQLRDVERELTTIGRKPTLVRPDWRNGTVYLAGWLKTGELAPKSLFVGAPSLVGDPLSVIAARLDTAGAALADAALRGNALPTVVIFELETLGLAGPLGVEAEADLQAIHDRLTLEGALTTPYGRARIAKTWETMARDNLIRVRVVDESGDVEGTRAEAMRRVGDDLVARMFSPFPPPERPPQLDNNVVAPLELSFRLTKRREELATTSRWSFRERRAVSIRHYAAASLVDLLGKRNPADHIRFADLEEDRHEVVVRAEPELARLSLAAMEVDIRSPAPSALARTVTLTDNHPEVRFNAAGPSTPLQFRARARFDPTKTSAKDRESAWLDAPSGLIVVSARRLFPPRVLTVIAGRIEFDWLDHVAVKVEAPDEPPRLFRLSANVRSIDTFFPAAGNAPLAVTVEWRGLRDEPTRSEPKRNVADDILVLDSPFADSLDILVVPLPLSNVATIVVELKSKFESFVHARTVSWNLPDRAPVRVGLRRLIGSPRTYSHRIQLIRDDGTIEQRPWTETMATTLVVGAQGPVDVRTAEVVLLGGGPAGRGSFAVDLTLAAGDQQTTEVLEGDRDSATLVLVVPKDSRAAVVLTAREFLNSGDIRETRWSNPEALTVITPIAIETP